MSFKNKMKNRGISKLDSLVETPDYITPVEKKKTNWNWLKIAIPVTAGLALIIVPMSMVFSSLSKASNKSSNYSGDKVVSGSDSSYDPSYDSPSDPAPVPGESSEAASQANTPFATLLANYSIKGNYIIEVYDYSDGYMEPTYTFKNEDAVNIVESLKNIDSDFDLYASKLGTAKRNSMGYVMGINHRLIIKDGTHQMICHYFSQFSSLIIGQSAFDISGSAAYTLMDSYIEMDYDSSFDETIN